MEPLIDRLTDDCLLLIFDYFEPLEWGTIAQVCSRWSRLCKIKFRSITRISLNNSAVCFIEYIDLEYFIQQKFKETTLDKIKSLLKYFGQHVRTIQLGTCQLNTISLNGQFWYRIIDRFNVQQFISRLSQTCTNVVLLDIENPKITERNFSEQLFSSNENLKMVTLPDRDLWFRNLTFASVEEVILKVSGRSELKNFELLFPNLRKVTLNIRSRSGRTEAIVKSILQRISGVKSLTIVVHNLNLEQYFLRFLSDLASFSQLEELIVWKKGNYNEYAEFHLWSVTKLIRNCQNLRVVKFDNIGLGAIDVSKFLALPKLEDLYVMNVTSFSSDSMKELHSNQFDNMARLQIKLSQKESLDLSGIFEAIKKMPALKYFIVSGLSAEETVDFACKIIEIRVSDNDILVVPAPSQVFEPFRVCKSGTLKLEPEPLRLLIEPQGDDYGEKVYKFCTGISVIDCDHKIGNVFETPFETYDNFFKLCPCSDWKEH